MLEAFERVARHLGPAELPRLRAELAPVAERLEAARAALGEVEAPDALRPFAERLWRGAEHAGRAARLFVGQAPSSQGDVAAILAAMREHCLAQAALFPVRRVLPLLDAWFLEPGFAWRLAALAEASERGESVGLHDASNGRDRRGGFTVFVPEDYDPARPWPLVMALHGGFGHGADFVWTWLREARARGWLLVAPTSRGTTWSLVGPDLDGAALDAMLAAVCERWHVDAGRMLLTGSSDGATYTLLHGLRADSPFTHLAPVSGVLHPLNFANGNLGRATGRPIRWVHGALDWMFPATLAREGVRILEGAGADVVYDEVPDLAHAYPRERGGSILAWATGTGELVGDRGA